MQKLISLALNIQFLFFSVLTTYAPLAHPIVSKRTEQIVKEDKYLFDNNCLDLAKKKDYVRGNQKLLNDAESRTERYFVWEKISKDYDDLVNDEALIKKADARYKEYNPLNPPPSLLLCEDSPQNRNECMAFKAYCTEHIAMEGMSEEMQEWSDRVKLCTNPKYIEKHPTHCQRSFVNSLNYLTAYAKKLGKTHENKSDNVAKYFKEAAATFSQYKHQLDELNQATEKAKLAEKLKKEREENEKLVKQAWNNCHQAVVYEDKDVKNRNLSGEVMGALVCTPADSLVTLDETKIEKLIASVDELNREEGAESIEPELNKISIKKAAQGIWSTYETFFAKENGSFDGDKGKEKAIQLICSPKIQDMGVQPFNCSKKVKEIIGESFDEYKELTDIYPMERVTDAELSDQMTNRINNPIKEINKACYEAKKDYDANERKYTCVSGPKIKMKDDGTFEMEPMTDADVMTESKCNGIIDEKFRQHRMVQSRAYNKANPVYNQMVQSQLGHLMIVDDFREKVGVASDDWVYERCFKGDGTAFGTVKLADVKSALNKFMGLNYKEFADALDVKETAKEKVERVKDYLKNNPITIAEFLKANPDDENVKALCALILDINRRDNRRLWVDRVVTGVGVVAGVALSMTGIGTPVGVGLLATLGAATTYEVVSLNKDIDEAKNDIEQKKRAAASFQLDMEKAIEDVIALKKEVVANERSKKLVVALAALDVLGSGGFRLMKNFLKTSKGIRAGRILGFSAHSLSSGSALKLSKQISVGIEQMLGRLPKTQKAFVNKLSHEEVMELGAIFNKLDPSDKAKLVAKLKEFENVKDYRKFLTLVDANTDVLFVGGKLNGNMVADLAGSAKKVQLPDGTIVDDLVNEKKVILSKIEDVKHVDEGNNLVKTVDNPDITVQNNGVVKPKEIYTKKYNKFNKRISENEKLTEAYSKVDLPNKEKQRLLTHMSFMDPKKEGKLLNILSDDKVVKAKFFEKVNKTGCLSKPYDMKCRNMIEEALEEFGEKELKDHKIYKDWVVKQSDDLQKLITDSGISPGELSLMDKTALEGIEIKNLDKMTRYVEKIKQLPIQKQIVALDELPTILQGGKANKSSKIYNNFKMQDKMFNAYEEMYYKTNHLYSKKNLKKIAKERGLKPTKENLDKIRREKALKFRENLQKKFNACKSGNVQGGQKANIKKFIKFNTASNWAFTIGSYMWFMGSSDDSEVVVDEEGNIVEGEPDPKFTEMLSVLGYDLVASYVFSQIPKVIMASPGQSVLGNTAKDYAMGGGLDFINTRIFGALFGADDKEANKEIASILNDPEKAAALEDLKKYVDEKMKKPKMQNIVADMSSQFGEFAGELESEDGYDYDYLMDNFSTEELSGQKEINEMFLESYQEQQDDESAGEYSLSKMMNNVTGGKVDVSLENDLFYYNLAYNIPSSAKRVMMYNIISNRICLGRWGEVITLTMMDKFISNATYWGGREQFVGK